MTDTKDSADLHDAIMNMPCKTPDYSEINYGHYYRIGHRDARHAAAELAKSCAAIAAAAPAGEPVTHFKGSRTIIFADQQEHLVLVPAGESVSLGSWPKSAMTDEQSESAALKAARAAIEWFAENGKNECYGRDWFPVEPEFVTLAREAIGEQP